MFERREHPGEFEFHVLLLGGIESFKGFDNVPANMNRYFAREIEMDIGSTSNSVFVQAKLCKMMAFGFVQMPNAREWKGTRVKMRRGTLGGPQSYYVPKNLGDYLVDRAKVVAGAHAALSERQNQNIVSDLWADPDRVAQSGTFEALSDDVELFGSAAFKRPKPMD